MLDALGQYSLYFAILLALVVFFSQWKSNDKSKGIAKYNFQLNIAAMILIWLSFVVLIIAFLENDYRFKVVDLYSDNNMSTIELIMAAWAQRQGVMILWSAIILSLSVWVMWYLKDEMSNPIVSRAITILLFFSALIAIFAASPRNPTAFELYDENLINYQIIIADGEGLTPALLSFWQEIHPPIAFLAYTAFVFPYASSIAILSLKKDGIKPPAKIYWLNDLFMLLGWTLTTLFIVAGSIWGYEENWSGFWAWDPVEIASLVMFFTSTLYFHVKTHVPKDHDLRLVSGALGWVSVVFATFIVRGGLLEGLHTYTKSVENQILSVVFGFLLLGSLLGLLLVIRGRYEDIIPEALYDWRNYESKSRLATFWLIVFGIVANTVGLIMQIFNSLVFEDTEIPYYYYMITNGIILFSLVIVLAICEIQSVKWSQYDIFLLFGSSGLIVFILFYFLLNHVIFVFLLAFIIGTIFLALIVNTVRLVMSKRKLKKISITIIHLLIILLTLSYFTVDQSSQYEPVTMKLGEIQEVPKFDLTMNFTDYKVSGSKGSGKDKLTFIFIVTIDDSNHIIKLTQGEYKGQKWSRGDWIIFATKDIYFHLIEVYLKYGPSNPIRIEIGEKPLANAFRITFGLVVLITIFGLYTTVKRKPKNNSDLVLL